VAGRYKVSRLKKPVFKVSVEKFDERLFDVPLRMTLLDSSSYQLAYDVNREKRAVAGTLDEMLITDELSVVVSLADARLHGRWQQLSYADYEFRVFSY